MNKMHKGLLALFLLVFLLVPAGPALAKGPLEGRVIFGDDFTLEAGETLDGDLVVFGGDVTIEEDAAVEGSLAVIGGDAVVAAGADIGGDVALIGGDMRSDGVIDGDVVVVGGQLSLGTTALVDGDITKVGAELEQAPGATITGEVFEEEAPSINMPAVPGVPPVPGVPNPPGPGFEIEVNPLGRIAEIFFQALGVGMVATLAALFLQPQMDRVGHAITGNPLIAGSFGLVTVLLAPLALALVAITIVLIPLTLLGAMALVLAWLFGVIALGWEVGRRLAGAVNQTWAPALAAGLGSFLLMIVTGYLGLIPCVGWLASFLVGLLGLGGTVLTLFGSRSYPWTAAPPAPSLPETA